MKKLVLTGKTVEDAVKQGIAQWNVPESRVLVNVLEQPSKRLFGLIGSKDAKVELELVPDAMEETVLFLKDVCESMNLRVDIEQIDDSDDGTLLNLHGKELGMLIGRRGQTLDALQYISNIVANRHSKSHVRVVLDAENFRERRRRTLEDLSQRLASRVMKTRKEVVLEPMSPQERKVIHSQLQQHPGVRTFSKGEEPNRRVVIALK